MSYFYNELIEGDTPAAAIDVLGELNSNQVQYKPTRKMADMEINTPYKIYSARRCLTKFGERVILDLGDYQMFLPPRYAKTTEQSINQLNEQRFSVINKGSVGKTFHLSFIQD